MGYSNQEIAQKIADLLKKNQRPIFQKGYTTSTGINREINVIVNGRTVRALAWNINVPGEVNVFWDSENGRYVAWRETNQSLKRRTVLANRKTRPDDKKYLWEYFVVVAQNDGLLQGFEDDKNLNIVDYNIFDIHNVGNGKYFYVFKKDRNNYIFGSDEKNISFTILDNEFSSNYFDITETEISASNTQKSVITNPTSYLQSNGGGVNSGFSNLFFPITPRYAGYVNFGFLANNNFYILNSTCTSTYILKTQDNQQQGLITQIIKYDDTERPDVTRTWDYSYTGSYNVPHEYFSANIDGYSIVENKDVVTIDITSKKEYDTTTNRVETIEIDYDHKILSDFDLGTNLDPVFDRYYDIRSYGNIKKVETKPKVYVVKVNIYNTLTERSWITDGWFDWEPELGDPIQQVYGGTWAQIYSKTQTPTIGYEITSNSYNIPNNGNSYPQTTFYLNPTEDYYTTTGRWLTTSKSTLNDLYNYYSFLSFAQVVIMTGDYYTVGNPNISVEYEPVGESYSDNIIYYDGEKSIDTKVLDSDKDENYTHNVVENIFIKKGEDCLLYRQIEEIYERKHYVNEYITWSNGNQTRVFERYEETTYTKPYPLYTLNLVVKNNVYKIEDYKNNIVDNEDRCIFYTYSNDYTLQIGSLEVEGYGEYGNGYNYSNFFVSDPPEKKLKTIYDYDNFDSYGQTQPPIYFDRNSFSWINKQVDIYKKDGDKVFKAIGIVTNADETNASNLTINITEVKEDKYHVVKEDFIDGLIIVPSNDYTTLIFNNFSNLKNRINIYVVKDENNVDTLEIAITEKPADLNQETLRTDIYRFNTTLKTFERKDNAESLLSTLTAASDFISYHPSAINTRKQKRRPPV